MHIVCISLGGFRFDDIRKSGHYSKVNKPNRCYLLIFVGAVIAAGSMSNLMSGVLPILFSGLAHSFISSLLLMNESTEYYWVV